VLELLLEVDAAGELQHVNVDLPWQELAPNGLKDLQLVDAGGGELLLTGADDSDPTGRRRAFFIDPIAKRMTRADASRVPSRLLRMNNGVIAEIDAAGTSLRATRSLGRYASPAMNLVTEGRQWLALDAPGHWLWQEQGVQALVPGARVDLAELRFAAFRAEVEVRGDFELVLYGGDGQELRVSAQSGQLQFGQCRAELPDPAALSLLRVGETLAISGTHCSARMFSGRVGLGLQLSAAAVLARLQLTRL
jgi:hypothetical protein